jgi:hypothetical protein
MLASCLNSTSLCGKRSDTSLHLLAVLSKLASHIKAHGKQRTAREAAGCAMGCLRQENRVPCGKVPKVSQALPVSLGATLASARSSSAVTPTENPASATPTATETRSTPSAEHARATSLLWIVLDVPRYQLLPMRSDSDMGMFTRVTGQDLDPDEIWSYFPAAHVAVPVECEMVSRLFFDRVKSIISFHFAGQNMRETTHEGIGDSFSGTYHMSDLGTLHVSLSKAMSRRSKSTAMTFHGPRFSLYGIQQRFRHELRVLKMLNALLGLFDVRARLRMPAFQ